MKETFIMKTNFLTDDDIELFTPEEIGLLMIAWSRFVQIGELPTRETLPVHLIVKFNQWKEFYYFNEQKYQNKVDGIMKARESNSKVQKSISDNSSVFSDNRNNGSENSSVSVSVSESVSESVSVFNREDNTRNNSVFIPPTLDEVREYCVDRMNGVDPQTFCDFYQSKGWMVGKNKMKDWKAAVRTWERERTVRTPSAQKKTVEEINLENYRRQYEKEVQRNEQRTDVKLFGVSEPGVLVKAH